MSENVFKLPDLGEGLTEAELVSWLVAVGDEVVLDQPIAEVETAKSLVQIPSPYAGVVHTLHGEPGEEILVGNPLITITVTAASDYRTEERAGVNPPKEDDGSGAVLIGYGTTDDGGRRRRRKKMAAPSAADSPATAESKQGALKVVSPLVRKLAHERGIDLKTVRGTGTGGLILRADVLAMADTDTPAAEAAVAGAEQVSPRTAIEAGTVDPRTGLGVAKVEPVKGVRKVVAEAMATSRRQIPEATVWVDLDVTELMTLRAQYKQEHGASPTLLAFVGRFVLAALQRFPELNTRFEGDEITFFDDVNLGFAMQTERGLMVPALAGSQGKSIVELDEQIRELTQRAREGQATTQELTRGTFTINNYGVFGVDGSAAIINHPEVAILGLGRVKERPWVVDGQIMPRQIMEVTLAFDHRVCDGGTASGFLSYVAECLEHPQRATMLL